jgi:hypothetical protein
MGELIEHGEARRGSRGQCSLNPEPASCSASIAVGRGGRRGRAR